MPFNPGQMILEAGLDTVSANSRVRALNNPVTFTDSSGTVTLTSIPLGVNYLDGAGVPFTTSIGTGTSITLAASNLLTGVVVLRNTSSTTATTDTAANIFTAAAAVSPSGVQPGDYISTLIMADGAAVVLSVGAGVTSANTSTSSIAANTSRYCLFRFNNATSLNLFF
jgi:hypothetical protein